MPLNEFDRIRAIALRGPGAAFRDAGTVARQWQALNYHAPPDLAAADHEFGAFVDALGLDGADVRYLPGAADLSLDAIYVRDALAVAPGGLVRLRMGKPARAAEPVVNAHALASSGMNVVGTIEAPGQLEGGDIVWFDEGTCAVGHGYRTNAEGIRQWRALLGPGVHVEVCPLPHYRGADDVFHLMSILSPLDRDLALVHSPLMPVPFRNWLLERGIELVEVAQAEFVSMGCNVLATAPRRCVMVDGNPVTRARLQGAGCSVSVYGGEELSRKGEGGPTCLTRPLLRSAMV